MRQEIPRRRSYTPSPAPAGRVAFSGPPVCSDCDHELDVHQPDSQDPDRLLGTCEVCRSWYLIEWEDGHTSDPVLLLPGPPRAGLDADDPR